MLRESQAQLLQADRDKDSRQSSHRREIPHEVSRYLRLDAVSEEENNKGADGDQRRSLPYRHPESRQKEQEKEKRNQLEKEIGERCPEREEILGERSDRGP